MRALEEHPGIDFSRRGKKINIIIFINEWTQVSRGFLAILGEGLT
jgi:hypothetical protein